MNCQNCAAPLVPVRGQTHFRCEHCGTDQFPEDVSGTVIDGVTPLDEVTNANCPSCRSTLQAGAIEGARVLFCEACRGMLIGSEEFGSVVQKRKALHAEPKEPPTPLDLSELQRRVPCPRCDRTMDVHPYHGRGNVVIDSCHRCKVVWFDYGELTVLERAAR